MNDLGPFPVTTIPSRLVWFWVQTLSRVCWNSLNRVLLREFSFEGREIVMCAILPLWRGVRCVRIVPRGEGGILVYGGG